jgi:Zn-dependent protease
MKIKKGKTGGVIVALGLLILSKLKWVLALLKFTKFGGTFISLIISLGFWAAVYGWKFAVAIVYLIFVHEMGHLVAARQKGIKTSPAIFIPFFGAVISMKEQPKDAATESYLAYGGPLAGLISIIPAFLLFFSTHQPFWALVIMLGAMINLFNLMPASPLDGGRIVGVLSPHLWLLGLISLVVFAYFYPSALIILILIIGFFSWWRRVREDLDIKTIQAEMSIKEELMQTVEGYREDLFYTYYIQDEEDGPPPVNEVMRAYIQRELNQRKMQAEDKKAQMKSWFFPFVEDQAKLEKRRLAILISELSTWVSKLDRITEPSDFDYLINDEKRQIRELQNRMEHINKYYDAKPKTRLIVFIAYVLLAVVLGVCYFYGENVLKHYYEYNQYLNKF